ncbi:RanBD1 domain-containing protein [Mycena chlorophos]|uniref:RanBD1 domain-containing protein n=1 Tax=Mycena chlorophos TaxID=658473 RepID=A0A8H6SUC1_MYCCL|nr:RanBD1 domain-containing protein [Mycena chlorophos]
MKRGADRQISKDDGDDADIEEIEPSTGFNKADEAILATRKIKPIPRRMGGDAEKPGTSPVKFAGFGASSNNAFSFSAPTPSPGFAAAKPSTGLFATPPSTLFPAPSVAPTATNAAKTLTSFLGDLSKPAASTTESADPAAVKLYTSLRGLNVSFVEYLKTAVEKDDFVDLSSVFSDYTRKRGEIQKEFDDASSEPAAPSPFGAPPKPIATASSSSLFGGSSTSSLFGAPPAAPSAPFKMPTAPTSFSFGGKTVAPTTTPAPAATAAPPPSTNGMSGGLPAAPTTAFSFGNSTAGTKPSVFTPPAASPFQTSSSSATPGFSFGSPPTTAFTASAAGTGTGASSTVNPFLSTSSPTPFGSGLKPSGSSTSLFPSSGGSGSGSGFTFGGSSSSSSSGAKRPQAGDGDGDGDGDPEGYQATEPASQETDYTPQGSSAEGKSGFFAPDVASAMDAEGEGEENEDTVHSARIKAYRMKKPDEPGPGGSPWADMGVGFIRLKKHKESSARRILLRNSHSGKVQINFALFHGFSATLKPKSLMFVGHDEKGVSQTYNVKFKTDSEALEFEAALKKEVAEIKPK